MSTRRRILIDNATLSGVERIAGISQTLNLNNISNDILCLEKLVTAILFSDELIGIDDYKDEFRAARLKNFDFVGFNKLNEAAYSELANDAATFCKGMTFSFNGAKPAGDVVSFFEALRIHPQLRWDVFVSSEYLTLSLLVEDTKNVAYENAIDSVFRTEGTDCGLVGTGTDHSPTVKASDRPDINDVKELVRALASENPQFKGIDGKSALERMVFGYGWAAERSYFYNAVAKTENADVCLAPLRDAFCESCFRLDYPTQATSLIETLKSKSQNTLSTILEPSGQAKFAMRLPFFVAYLISKSDDPLQCIDLALSMRNHSDFQECRTIFHNLEHLEHATKVQEVNGILQYLDQSCTNLMKKYAVSTDNGLQFSLSLGLTGVSFGASFKLGELFRQHKNRPFTRVFRNIAQDMINVERLGSLHDKLCSAIRQHKYATYSTVSTTPKFMEHKENAYGRPAT